ncbi:hypothetical protein ScPMuIL_015722 [Solemya velum]
MRDECTTRDDSLNNMQPPFGRQLSSKIGNHLCYKNVTKTVVKSEPCGDFIDQFVAGFAPNMNVEPFKSMLQDEIREYLFDQSMLMLNNETGEDCPFIGSELYEQSFCCPGYEGPNCENAQCPDQCVHGNCVRPYNCDCDEGYTGIDCSEDLSDVSDTLKFCYKQDTCFGKRLDEYDSSAVTYDECCSGNGSSWGVYKKHDATDCVTCPINALNGFDGNYTIMFLYCVFQ